MTLEADFNFVCGINGSPKRVAPPDDGYHWAITGQEVRGVNGGDPLFQDPEHLGFQLLENSPLLGRGTRLAEFTETLYGQPRPAAWSIGPLEAATFSAVDLVSPTKPLHVRQVLSP